MAAHSGRLDAANDARAPLRVRAASARFDGAVCDRISERSRDRLGPTRQWVACHWSASESPAALVVADVEQAFDARKLSDENHQTLMREHREVAFLNPPWVEAPGAPIGLTTPNSCAAPLAAI